MIEKMKLINQNENIDTHPFNEVTPIRICIECFICLQGCCNLSCYFFPDPIIHRDRPNLKY